MRLKAQLLLASAAYADATGIREGGVSRLLFGNGNCLKGLRGGADILSGRAEDALQKLSDHWPEGARWPCEVPRPAPAPLPVEPAAEV